MSGPPPAPRLRTCAAAFLAAALALGLAGGCGEEAGRPRSAATSEPADAASGEQAGKPAPASTDVQVPVGPGVTLDGRVLPAEWDGAAQRPIGTDGGVLRLVQRDGTLFVALSSPCPWAEGASLWLGFRPDVPEAGGLFDPGAVRVDFEPRAHHRAHLLVFTVRPEGEVVVPDAGVARARPDGARSDVELALSLPRLGVDVRAPTALRFLALWMRGVEAGAATWPPGISTAGPPLEPPPDLASSARWGRLTGWVDPGGPGGLPASEWAALAARDGEIARRGEAAHARARALAEDVEVPKKDGEILGEVVENLRWIAAWEPLTPDDLRVLAQAYRHLNRPDEALATLEALAAHPTWRGSMRLLYEQARALEAAQRYEQAAQAWESVAALAPPPLAPQYAATAEQARKRAAGWAAERTEREAAAARRDLPLVLLRTTRGEVLVCLHAHDVPASVAHFLDLVRRREDGRGFYDGTRFHRVLSGFLVQGGDPASREDCASAGQGAGPTSIPLEAASRHGFWRGALGYARASALVNGSQFFLLTGDRPALAEEDFTCFGHVAAGMDVVDRLEVCDELIEARVLSGATGEEDR